MKLATILQKRDLSSTVLTFHDKSSNADKVIAADEKVIKALYDATKPMQDLNSYRYECFLKCIAGSKSQSANLPPSGVAARQHSFHLFLQIQIWLRNRCDPMRWGWHQTANGLQPVETDLQPALQEILKLISCGCKKSCSAACGCHRVGHLCSSVCTACCGISCLNTSAITLG